MARLQPGGNHGQAMGALSFCSGPDASLAAATPARCRGCGPGIVELAVAALAPDGLAAGLCVQEYIQDDDVTKKIR